MLSVAFLEWLLSRAASLCPEVLQSQTPICLQQSEASLEPKALALIASLSATI
jgi:hypothetical protein